MSCKLHLDLFEGPLDLLLYLIKKNEINIYDIPVVVVTEQYIQYIEVMKMMDLDGIGEFLVMAAELLRIKSKMLLPPDPAAEEDQEDPRAELVRKIEEYQRIREAAEELRLRGEQRSDLFPRRVDLEAAQQLREESREVYFEANLFDLVTSLSKALQRKPEKTAYEIVREEFTVEEKVHQVLHVLLVHSKVRLDELFERASSKMEVIVTFMAVLELCRMKELVIVQKRVFSDIELLRNTDQIRVVANPVPVPGDTSANQDVIAPVV